MRRAILIYLAKPSSSSRRDPTRIITDDIRELAPSLHQLAKDSSVHPGTAEMTLPTQGARAATSSPSSRPRPTSTTRAAPRVGDATPCGALACLPKYEFRRLLRPPRRRRTCRRRRLPRLVVRRPVLQHRRVAAPAQQPVPVVSLAPTSNSAPDGVTVVRRHVILG